MVTLWDERAMTDPDPDHEGDSRTGTTPQETAAAPPGPDYKDLFLRASAELENYRKRIDREKAALASYASESVVRKLLEPYDSFGRAIADLARVHADAPRDVKASLGRSLEGLRALERQLRDLLTAEGVAPIEALGEEFDPAVHEALVRLPHKSAPQGTVIEVLQPGYTMRGKLLRPARVAVSEGEAGSGEAEDASPTQATPESRMGSGKKTSQH